MQRYCVAMAWRWGSQWRRSLHAPAGEAPAPPLWAFSLHALRCFARGRVLMGREEKTGRQRLPRTAPPPLAPGTPEKRAPEDLRPGVRAWSASLVVAPGHGGGHRGPPRPSADCAPPLATVVPPR